MRPLSRLVGSILLAAGLLILGAMKTDASGSSATSTFADVVAKAKLIVLVSIHHRTDGGFTLDVEHVLKGQSANQLVFPPSIAPPLDGWARAIIAFSVPTTLDFRAPTIAWHVAADGTIDPERFQQLPGVPQTLDAMLGYFGLPSTDTRASPTATSWITWAGVLLVLMSLTVIAAGRFGRERWTQWVGKPTRR